MIKYLKINNAEIDKLQNKGEHTMSSVKINNWEVVEVKGEPTVRDTDLAEKLGFERPRAIRQLIKRMIDNGAFKSATPCGSFEKARNGAEVEVFHLNEKQALKVISKSETKKADEIMDEVIDVFIAFRNGELNDRDNGLNLNDIYITNESDAYKVKLELSDTKHQVTTEKLHNATDKLEMISENHALKLGYIKKEVEVLETRVKSLSEDNRDLTITINRQNAELNNCYTEIEKLKQSLEDQIIDFQSMPALSTSSEDKVLCSIARKNITKTILLRVLKVKYFTNIPNRFIGKKANVVISDIPIILKYFNMQKRSKMILDKSDFKVTGVFSDKLTSFVNLQKMSNDEKREMVISKIKNNSKPLSIKKDLLISQHYYEQCLKECKNMEKIGE